MLARIEQDWQLTGEYLAKIEVLVDEAPPDLLQAWTEHYTVMPTICLTQYHT